MSRGNPAARDARRDDRRDDPVELAVRALRHRDRSRADVAQRLERAGVDGEKRAEALETLERLGYVDDARFAATRAAALAARDLGDEAIRADLDGNGVSGEARDAAVAALEPERERAIAVAERRGRSAKTAALLARKGFGEDAIAAAVGAALGEVCGG